MCIKPLGYSRGAGKLRGGNDMEKLGLFWYPKCRSGYKGMMGLMCVAECPNGMKELGNACVKDQYSRGFGKSLECPSGTKEQGLMCKKECKSGYESKGVSCLKQCPSGYSVCGGNLCMKGVDC
jgi:hypothetical protein